MGEVSRRNEDGSEIRTMIYDPLIKIVINSRMKSGGRLYALVSYWTASIDRYVKTTVTDAVRVAAPTFELV